MTNFVLHGGPSTMRHITSTQNLRFLFQGASLVQKPKVRSKQMIEKGATTLTLNVSLTAAGLSMACEDDSRLQGAAQGRRAHGSLVLIGSGSVLERTNTLRQQDLRPQQQQQFRPRRPCLCARLCHRPYARPPHPCPSRARSCSQTVSADACNEGFGKGSFRPVIIRTHCDLRRHTSS